MPSLRTIGSQATTAILVLCAVAVTGFTIRRELRPGGRRSAIEDQKDWRSYADGGHRLGGSDSAVTLIEFSDFQCPACAVFEKRLVELRQRYPGQLSILYRHFPLPSHEFAEAAAVASECAGQQGRFEAMHDTLFAQRDSLGHIPWSRFAAHAAVPDVAQFNACLGDSSVVATVRRDVDAGKRLELRGTPTTLVDGKRIHGVVPLDTLDALIRHAIQSRHAR